MQTYIMGSVSSGFGFAEGDARRMGARFNVILSSGERLPSNIRDEATAHDQNRLLLDLSQCYRRKGSGRAETRGYYLADDSELGHGINDAQEGWNRFCLFPDLGLMDFEGNLVMGKIFFDLLAIYVVDI